MRTVWVLGDQLDATRGPLAGASPHDTTVLLVESERLLAAKPWHRQRAHLVVTAMRRFAEERRDEGFTVEVRRARTLSEGFTAHVAEHRPDEVVAVEPMSWDADRLLRGLGVRLEPNEHFLCHRNDFAAWAEHRRRLTMEDFYRWQRTRLGYLMDGDTPAGGRWNFDADNREPPPTDGRGWPEPVRTPLDQLDRDVLAGLAETSPGADPVGVWPTSRGEALRRLDHVIGEVLAHFGPHEDAMLSDNWHLAHTLLSPALNLGLLHPSEVCDAVEVAYRAGEVPISSAEGLVRQVIGWREFVWGCYWHWMPDYRSVNELGADRPLPPVFTGAPTSMRCVASVLADVHDYGWTHHIARLMVLGNLSLLAGVRPAELTEWMWASFVDGAEWVMLPNVLGMALHADGGKMATKPYAAGGAYIDKMSDFCGDCRYDRRKRTGEDACPFTTLYWDFFDRHRERFLRNARVARQVRAADRLGNLDDVRARARVVLDMLDDGTL